MFVAQRHQSEPEHVENAVKVETCGADPDPDNPVAPGAKPWKPSGALSNPDPTIPDLTVQQYNQSQDKSEFGRLAAAIPMQEAPHYQCSVIEAGTFYQDKDLSKEMPMLAVHCCMFIC